MNASTAFAFVHRRAAKGDGHELRDKTPAAANRRPALSTWGASTNRRVARSLNQRKENASGRCFFWRRQSDGGLARQ
jgi:hypothetical protein